MTTPPDHHDPYDVSTEGLPDDAVDTPAGLSRRDAGVWLARAGVSVGALALLAGCASPGPSRPPMSSRDIRPARRTGAADSVRNTPGAKALERYRARQADAGVLPPGVIARSTWTNARPVASRAKPLGSITRITVHHDGMSPFTSTSRDLAARRLESIRRAHVGSNGWADIGYHYAFDPAGRVYVPRPTVIQGAHVKYNNEGNLGILVMGNYQRQRPTDATMRTLERFVVDRARAYRLSREDIHTHRELRPTACPGRYLQRHMESVRARGGAIALAMA